METNKLTPVQWFASKSEDLRGKLTLGAISPIEYYEELNSVLKVALEMEKQQIIDANMAGQMFIGACPSHYKNDAEDYYNETFKQD